MPTSCLRQFPRSPRSPHLVRTILIIVIAFTVLRNLPFWPCTLLAPFTIH